MTPAAFIARCRDNGVHLSVTDSGRLYVKPIRPDAITPAVRAALETYKGVLIDYLQSPTIFDQWESEAASIPETIDPCIILSPGTTTSKPRATYLYYVRRARFLSRYLGDSWSCPPPHTPVALSDGPIVMQKIQTIPNSIYERQLQELLMLVSYVNLLVKGYQ